MMEISNAGRQFKFALKDSGPKESQFVLLHPFESVPFTRFLAGLQ